VCLKEQNQPNLFESLIELVARLRRECPWDREQTLESMKPFMMEEAFEVAEAVQSRDSEKLREELGDLLLVILLLCEISDEFSVEEVLSGVINKMKTRHPHVFGQERLDSSQQVIERWEQIKRDSRKPEPAGALKKAWDLNDQAIEMGFNPSSLEDVTAKLAEEAGEVKRATTEEERLQESGDLLFTAVNICRMLDVDPESALLESSAKFERRFKKVIKELERQGKKPAETPFQAMDELWNRIK
jgi:tetrapyrrole methylase family protein/MazG family protein